MTNWEKLHKGIHQYGLYDGEDPVVDGIMDDMTNQQFVDIGTLHEHNRTEQSRTEHNRTL